MSRIEKPIKILLGTLAIFAVPISLAHSEDSYPLLLCRVDSGYGNFSSYSMSPAQGDNTEINLKKLLHERTSINFTTNRRDRPYVPAQEPFKVLWYDKFPDGRIESARFKAGGSSEVTLDVRSVGAPDLKKYEAVILSEYRNVTGAVFMTCSAKWPLTHN